MNFKVTETATPSHVSVIVVSPEVTPGFMEILPSVGCTKFLFDKVGQA